MLKSLENGWNLLLQDASIFIQDSIMIKRRKKGGEKNDEQKPIAIPNRKKYSAKRGLYKEPIHGTTDLENKLEGMKRRWRIILDWYSSPIVNDQYFSIIGVFKMIP